jgi:hypothetical protein
MVLTKSCKQMFVNCSHIREDSNLPLETGSDLKVMACDDWQPMLFFHLFSFAGVIFTPPVLNDPGLGAGPRSWRMPCRSEKLVFFLNFQSPNFLINCFFLSGCQHYL